MTISILNPEDIARNIVSFGANVDVNKTYPAIKHAQLTKLLPVLGKTLYDKIVSDFDTDALTGLYLELYEDYIINYLTTCAAVIYLKTQGIFVGNAGVLKNNPEGTTGPSRNDIDYVANENYNLSVSYERMMVEWLMTNDLPEYKKTTCAPKSNLNVLSGFHIPQNNNYYGYGRDRRY